MQHEQVAYDSLMRIAEQAAADRHYGGALFIADTADIMAQSSEVGINTTRSRKLIGELTELIQGSKLDQMLAHANDARVVSGIVGSALRESRK